jgi:hypothetical protein
MVRFQRHCLIASLQYIGNHAENLSIDCSVIRQDMCMGDISVARQMVNCGDE